MYGNVLVPTDGSEGTAAVLDHAVEVADDTGATVHGLYVVDQQVVLATSKDNQESVRADLREEGERAVGTVSDVATDADLEAVTAVAEGVPHREILTYIEEEDIDLVVMGTHGRRGRDRIVSLGSVTERVVGSARVPVLTVWIGED
jgi:nucleotide-binding universal stress UspA family protein